MTITDEWRGAFDNIEINALHAEGFHHAPLTVDWWSQVNRHSLGWVCARDEGAFVGSTWPGTAPFTFFCSTPSLPREPTAGESKRGSSPSPPTTPVRPAAHGSMWTSRITFGPSMSTPVASFPRTPASSPCSSGVPVAMTRRGRKAPDRPPRRIRASPPTPVTGRGSVHDARSTPRQATPPSRSPRTRCTPRLPR